MQSKPTPKYKVGDKVIVDGDRATITAIVPPADSEMFSDQIGYTVTFPLTNEWGTFEEYELELIDE